MLTYLILFTALLAFMFIGLSIQTIRTRRLYSISLGDQNNDALKRALRAHGNFAEYVPFSLGLLWLMATVAALPLLASGLAFLLLIARILHAYGLLIAEPKHKYFVPRIAGMAGTFTTIGLASCALLIHGFFTTHP